MIAAAPAACLAMACWAAPAAAQEVTASSASQTAPAEQAPQQESEWKFEPRGRLQLDIGRISASDAVEAAANSVTPGGLKTDLIARRFFLGADIEMPGNLTLRIEGDFASEIEGETVSWTDAYLLWEPSDKFNVTLGNHKPAYGLEEQTSDLFPTFMERAALNTAFGNERRVGVGVEYNPGDFVLQGGAYIDDLDAIMDNVDQGHSYFGRAVYAPKLGGGRLHLGARVNYRSLDEAGVNIRYSTRPFLRTVDTRFVNTGSMAGVTGETGYGAEFAYINGPLHVTGEAQWQHASRVGALSDPTFFGYYVEAGYYLTKGDSRGYRGGNFDRTKPKNPLGKGGFGALQVNLRYDHLDLNDAGIVGGIQDSYALGLVWTPTNHTRLIANYARVEFDDAVIPAGGDRSYGVNAFGLRAQFDF